MKRSDCWAALSARVQSPSLAFVHSKTCGFHGSCAPGTGSLRCSRLFVHSLLRTVALVITVAVVLPLASGCGGGGKKEGAQQGPAPNDGLVDLKTLLDAVKAGQQKAPKSAAEMAAIEPMFPAAGAFIQNGSIEYVWGAKLSDGPDAAKTVVGFEAKAAKEGGFILLQDGTVKQVSAAEFGGLTKAKP